MSRAFPDRYIVISDCEIAFCGSKQQCREYYASLPNPLSMTLLKIENEWELRRK